MISNDILSWGRTLRAEHEAFSVHDRHAHLPATSGISGLNKTFLPFGNGRSYGDVALNPNGGLLLTRSLDRFIAFDPNTGVLRCEAGVLLDDILALVVPQGWFLAVTPGTRFVTVGGAIANDVHGKNHHREGCFSRHVRAFELLRSDHTRRVCSATENPEWFAATCGGLGLTGLITWADIQLKRIANPWMIGFQQRFNRLGEFFRLSEQADRDYEYSVAWIDCASSGDTLGRGILMAANHAPAGFNPSTTAPTKRPMTFPLTFPITPPVSLVNTVSLNLFNSLYFHRIREGRQPLTQHYQPFFYPLDGILAWNRMYGPRGFHQYQCVLPSDMGKTAVADLLKQISRSGFGSFLAVLKVCGDMPSPGMLSFPRQGVSLALDFAERGPRLEALFQRLDAIVSATGGRLYPAKDSRMPASLFQSSYPYWQRFQHFIDPPFSSAFWRRVSQGSVSKLSA